MAGMGNYLAVLQALSQLPQPGRPSPIAITPPFIPPMEPPESVRFPMPEPPPPAPGRNPAEFLPEILARVRGAMGSGTPPYTPPAPAQGPGGFGAVIRHLLRNLPQAVAVGTSADPGAALQQQLQQQTLLSERRRQEELARQEKIEDRRYSEDQFVRRTALGEAQQQADRAQKRQQDEADRRFELDVAERAKRLGLKDEKEMALFRDSLLAKRQREDDERAAKVAAAKAEEDQRKEVRTQANTFFDDYKQDGISRSQAMRFAEHEINGTPLPAADRKAYDRTVKTSKEGKASPSATNKLSQFEILKGQLQAAQTREDSVMEKRIKTQLANLMMRMPSNIEAGFDSSGEPFARVKGQPAGPPPGEPGSPYEGPPAPSGPSLSRTQAKAKLVANRYSDAEAEAELNRLGIR